MILSDDEIIIQIIKGNQEALGLLFLYYEKHFRKLEIKTRNYRKNNLLEYEDLESFMKANMINIIKQYDSVKSSFFAFWSLLEYRHILGKMRVSEMYDFQCVSIEEWNIEKVSLEISENIVSNYSFKEQYNEQLDKIEHRYGLDCKNIIVYWSRGYSYLEISQIFNCEVQKINYEIMKALSYLKKNK